MQALPASHDWLPSVVDFPSGKGPMIGYFFGRSSAIDDVINAFKGGWNQVSGPCSQCGRTSAVNPPTRWHRSAVYRIGIWDEKTRWIYPVRREWRELWYDCNHISNGAKGGKQLQSDFAKHRNLLPRNMANFMQEGGPSCTFMNPTDYRIYRRSMTFL